MVPTLTAATSIRASPMRREAGATDGDAASVTGQCSSRSCGFESRRATARDERQRWRARDAVLTVTSRHVVTSRPVPSPSVRPSVRSELRPFLLRDVALRRERATSVRLSSPFLPSLFSPLSLSIAPSFFHPSANLLSSRGTAQQSARTQCTHLLYARTISPRTPFALPRSRATGRRTETRGTKSQSLARRRRRRRERFTLPSARCAGPRSSAHGRTEVDRARPPRPVHPFS